MHLALQGNIHCGLCSGAEIVTLQKLHATELLQHLSNKHLPLRCTKCLTVSVYLKLWNCNPILNLMLISLFPDICKFK